MILVGRTLGQSKLPDRLPGESAHDYVLRVTRMIEADGSACPGRLPGESVFQCVSRVAHVKAEQEQAARQQQETKLSALVWIVPGSIVLLGLIAAVVEIVRGRRSRGTKGLGDYPRADLRCSRWGRMRDGTWTRLCWTEGERDRFSIGAYKCGKQWCWDVLGTAFGEHVDIRGIAENRTADSAKLGALFAAKAALRERLGAAVP